MITTLLHLLRLFPFLCGGHRQLAVTLAALAVVDDRFLPRRP